MGTLVNVGICVQGVLLCKKWSFAYIRGFPVVKSWAPSIPPLPYVHPTSLTVILDNFLQVVGNMDVHKKMVVDV